MKGFAFVGVMSIEDLAAAVARHLEKRYVSVDEYSRMLGISRRTVERAIAEGRLEVERSGRRISIDRDAKISGLRTTSKRKVAGGKSETN